MARQHRRSGFVASQRRLTQWFRSADVSGQTTLGAGVAVLDQSLAGITEPVTVVRCRGLISVNTDQAAASETVMGAVGMCVVSDQAFTAGVASIPTPITDKDSDLWIMHQYFQTRYQFRTGVGADVISQTFEFDSKAMRKVPEGSRLVWAVENASGSAGLSYILQFAVLIKLA